MTSSLLPLLYCSCKCKSKFESYTTHCHILNTTKCMYKKGWTQRGCLRRGRGGTESQRLEPTVQAATWEECERGIEPPLNQIFFSKNAFQAILETHFPYSITSFLSKVVHSNKLFLTISFEFPCRPLDALGRFPCEGRGGAQQLQCESESAQCS